MSLLRWSGRRRPRPIDRAGRVPLAPVRRRGGGPQGDPVRGAVAVTGRFTGGRGMTARQLLRILVGIASAATVALAASVAIAAASPQPESGLGLPRDVSSEGHRIDWLMGVTNVLTGILFLIMLGWIL